MIFERYRAFVSRHTSVRYMTILCFPRQIALDLAVWSFCASTRMTVYHAKYFAHKLTRRCPSASVGKLVASLADAQVDLNPHQIDATCPARSAMKTPKAKPQSLPGNATSAAPSSRPTGKCRTAFSPTLKFDLHFSNFAPAPPGQLFYSTQIPVCVGFLAKNENADAKGGFGDRRQQTLFIDARKLGTLTDRVPLTFPTTEPNLCQTSSTSPFVLFCLSSGQSQLLSRHFLVR